MLSITVTPSSLSGAGLPDAIHTADQPEERDPRTSLSQLSPTMTMSRGSALSLETTSAKAPGVGLPTPISPEIATVSKREPSPAPAA